MKLLKNMLVFCVTIFLCGALLYNGKTAVEGALKGIKLCTEIIIPSTFPFMVLASFIPLSGLGKWLMLPFLPITRYLLRIPDEAASAVVMSFIGGYPAGAKALSAMVDYDMIPRPLAGRLLLYTTNVSPSFAIVAVGQMMWGRPMLGAVIFAAQILSSLTIGAILRPPKREATTSGSKALPASAAFVLAVSNAATAMVAICGFIVFFAVLSGLITDYLSAFDLPELLGIGISGFLEVTGGCKLASKLGSIEGLLLSAFFLSFAGVSIIFQNISIASSSKIPTKGFFLCRVVGGLLTTLITWLLLRLIPSSLLVMAMPAPPKIIYSANQIVGAMVLIGMCIMITVSGEPLYNRSHLLHPAKE